MRYYLDGSDWEADYFIPDEDCCRWQMAAWNLHNMLLDNASGAGFADPDANAPASYRATVPGCDRSVLLENGVISDPYYGRNMDHSRWSEKAAWAFRKSFVLPENIREKERFQLHFCGIDYRAAFFLNGRCLGHHTGAFIPFDADVTDHIRREGENLLAVIFDPMPQASPNHTDPFIMKPAEFADFHRSQMSYGWDWARAMAAAGIWDHVYLEGFDTARIADCFFRGDDSGNVDLTLDIQAVCNTSQTLEISLEPVGFKGRKFEFEEKLTLGYGRCTRKVNFQCPDAALWYPNGYGEQNLYSLKLSLAGEVICKQVGFRKLEMVRNVNSPDGAYDLTFCINGKKIFARGVNWVPSDMMYCRCDGDKYERLVRLAADGHTNLFRIWGGGIIEKEEFYAACDRYGIMVWQEFMHACSSYRKDPEYLAFKEREAEAVLRKIRNHVSLSLICGGNELLYYGEIPNSPLLMLYKRKSAELTPDLPYHITSPDRSRPGERDHGPWHFIEHELINKDNRLLVSEVGCPGFTEFDSVKKFIPQADWERPLSQNWKYHFAIPRGAQGWQMQTESFSCRNSAELCQAVMATQSNINCYWLNHCRRQFPHTSGCFFWQYNEPWPTLSLSIVDYYTLPKTAYYHLKRCQQSTTLALKENSWFCRGGRFAAELFLISDREEADLEYTFRLLTADGVVLAEKREHCSAISGAVKVDDISSVELPASPVGGVILAEMRLYRGKEEIFADTQLYGVPDFKKVFTVPEAEISASAVIEKDESGRENILRVTLHNRNLAALYLRLDLPECDLKRVYWQDNYITLAPGEKRIVTANITCSDEVPGDLEISAWNCPAKKIPLEFA